MAVPFDLVIRGGTVVDGSGGPEYIADIGVSGGVIAGSRSGSASAIGAVLADAEYRQPAPGHALCPA